MTLTYKKISPAEIDSIHQISDWYFNEWGIAKKETVERLADHSNKNVIFQTLMLKDQTPIGTGGLYHKVGIQNRIKKYENHAPWVALMYTVPEMRGKGLGGQLLSSIESEAQKKGIETIYLFTYTAEALYKRKGWNEMDRYQLGEKNIVIMNKNIKALPYASKI